MYSSIGIIASLVCLDQLIKGILLVKYDYLLNVCTPINQFISLHPKFNEEVNWYNVMFDMGITSRMYILLGVITTIIMCTTLAYCKYEVDNGRNYRGKWYKYIVLIIAGGICGISDQVFLGNTLDYIEVSKIAIIDLKDMYLLIGGLGLTIVAIIEDIKYKPSIREEMKKIPKAIHHCVKLMRNEQVNKSK